MKKRATDEAANPDAPPTLAASRGSAALETWAVQMLRERLAAAAAGAKPRLGDDDAMPFSGKSSLTGGDLDALPDFSKWANLAKHEAAKERRSADAWRLRSLE